LTLDDLEGQYCNRNSIGCSASILATRFISNLAACVRYLLWLFTTKRHYLTATCGLLVRLHSVAIHIVWRDDRARRMLY